MFDQSTASVVVSAILTTGATIIVAILRLVPGRAQRAGGDASPHSETKLAVLETELRNLRVAFNELRAEMHELRKEMRLSPDGRRSLPTA